MCLTSEQIIQYLDASIHKNVRICDSKGKSVSEHDVVKYYENDKQSINGNKWRVTLKIQAICLTL